VVELRAGAADIKVIPGPSCRWCPALPDCDEGRRHLDDEADAGGW